MVDENYDTSRMPGWENGSLGYHTDDGKIYHNDTTGRETKGLKDSVNFKIFVNEVAVVEHC